MCLIKTILNFCSSCFHPWTLESHPSHMPHMQVNQGFMCAMQLLSQLGYIPSPPNSASRLPIGEGAPLSPAHSSPATAGITGKRTAAVLHRMSVCTGAQTWVWWGLQAGPGPPRKLVSKQVLQPGSSVSNTGFWTIHEMRPLNCSALYLIIYKTQPMRMIKMPKENSILAKPESHRSEIVSLRHANTRASPRDPEINWPTSASGLQCAHYSSS